MRERFGRWEGLKLAFIGDGNNVAHSLRLTAGRLGMSIAVGCPAGYEPNAAILSQAAAAGVSVTVTPDAAEAASGANVIYTDVWASMGQESEADKRSRIFFPYQVNARLMAKAPTGCLFMHDLPARRGKEVTDDVIDGPNSIVFQQAENRMHLAKGLLVWLLCS